METKSEITVELRGGLGIEFSRGEKSLGMPLYQ